jgi:hypothetical protein
MDQYTVPQFIEREPKIVGPLTFKQFIFIGIAAGFCFFLYFTAPFGIFILSSMVIMGLGTALAFVKSGGRSLPFVLKNFFVYSVSPKIYLWRKKEGLPPKIMVQKNIPELKNEKSTVPSAVGKSRLNELSTKIGTKNGE